MHNKIIFPALKIEICSLLSHEITQTFFCLLAIEHFCMGCNLFCTMYLHGSENETGLSPCPYIFAILCDVAIKSFLCGFLAYFCQMASVTITDRICQRIIKEHTCISLIASIQEGAVLFNQFSFHFDSIIVNDWQTLRGSQA